MPKKTSDPNRSYVRTVVHYKAHANARKIAQYLNVTVTYLYTLILTRDLFDCDPFEYAIRLSEDLQPEERTEPDAP